MVAPAAKAASEPAGSSGSKERNLEQILKFAPSESSDCKESVRAGDQFVNGVQDSRVTNQDPFHQTCGS